MSSSRRQIIDLTMIRNALICLILVGLSWSCKDSDLIIDGYTDKLSYSPGDTAIVYVNAAATLDNVIIPLNTLNKSQVASVTVSVQPQEIQNKEPWTNGFGYKETFRFVIPNDLQSGIYRWNDQIPMLIKERAPKAKVVVVLEVNTLNAYNRAGGKSLYVSEVEGDEQHSYEVSFLRPFTIHKYSWWFYKWLEKIRVHYDVAYITDLDMENYENIAEAKIVVIPGHSEYWTRNARQNFDRFVDEGGDAMILSGNTMWWQVRLNEDQTKMICYKSFRLDPEPDTLLNTHNFDWEGLKYPITRSIGMDFGNAGYGRDDGKGFRGYKITSPNSPLLIGTGLQKGDTLDCWTSEYDGPPYTGFDEEGVPIIRTNELEFYRYEMIGFDHAWRDADGVGAFIVMQKRKSSGKVINVGTTNWGERRVHKEGKSSFDIQLITLNMLNLLLNDQEIFSENALKRD